MAAVKAQGLRKAPVSDIHLDVRPVFVSAGLGGLIDVYVLSYEHGVQKPDPAIFRIALEALHCGPREVLMVGDRAGYDGAAAALGIGTLLLPPLTSADDQRLGLVEALLGPPHQ